MKISRVFVAVCGVVGATTPSLVALDEQAGWPLWLVAGAGACGVVAFVWICGVVSGAIEP